MKDFDFEKDFDFKMNDSKTDLHFKKKHEASENVIDFTNKIICNKIMRFEIVRDLNFKIPSPGENLFLITTKSISLLDVVNFIEVQDVLFQT